jgi:hypothetical protein
MAKAGAEKSCAGNRSDVRCSRIRPGKRNYIPVMIIALAASLVLGRHLLPFLYM